MKTSVINFALKTMDLSPTDRENLSAAAELMVKRHLGDLLSGEMLDSEFMELMDDCLHFVDQFQTLTA